MRPKVRIKVEATPDEKREALERAKYQKQLQKTGSILSLLVHSTEEAKKEEEDYDEEEEMKKYSRDAAKKLRAKMNQLLEDSEQGRRGRRRARRQQQPVVFRKSGYTRRVGLVAVASQRMMG